ncbi:MAG: hypothetical protein MUF06_12020 [Pirellulaceae bacterium]|nr:hypothetical protein [Pirellulaceae bacterium]
MIAKRFYFATGCVALVLLAHIPRMPAVQGAELAGYEFFDKTPVDSFHVLDTTPDVIFDIAPNPPMFVNPSGKKDEQQYRIIDIAITKTWTSKWRFSAVFVKRESKFDRKSWLLYDLTEDQVHQLPLVPGWIAIDIEYTWVPISPGNNERRYAVVLVECPEKYDWMVLTEASPGTVANLTRREWRPIDLDSYDDSLWPDNIPKVEDHRYNGILVENSGPNYLETTYLMCTGDDIDALAAAGWQAIDVQQLHTNVAHFHPDQEYHAVFVRTGNWFWVRKNSSPDELKEWEATYGRMIDLKDTGSAATFLHP